MHIEPPHVTQDRRGWHIDKGISLATITSIVITFVTLIAWALSIEKRVELSEYIQKEMLHTRKDLLDQQAEKNTKHAQDIESLKKSVRDIEEYMRRHP